MKSRVLPGILVLAVLSAAGYSGRHYFSVSDSINVDHSADLAEVEPDAQSPPTVTLPAEKLKEAGIQFTNVASTQMRLQSNVPGRLRYDDRRHIEVRSATPGIITAVRVNPGDQVNAGDVLIELSSPEVGNVRADVLQRMAELQLATENREWEREISTGLAKLTAAIRERMPVERIKQDFKNVTLGKNREQLLSAYSDLLLAESLLDSIRDNAKNGVVPGRIVEERTNTRDNAEAALLTALESLLYASKVSLRRADAIAEDAERRLQISQQAVQTLLGLSTGAKPDADHDTIIETADMNSGNESLSLIKLRAPFAGTVERRQFSPGERVAAGDGMLTLADTSTLWVAADLRERDWNALVLKTGDEILVEIATPEAHRIPARVHFVGREVDPTSNAIPLIAVVDNSDGRLRPGMFVRVTVPLAESREALTVPESAIQEHDRQAFVFSPVAGGGFCRINIIPGMRVNDLVEIVSGLNVGESVVSSGGFYLKSEMLLEGEE